MSARVIHCCIDIGWVLHRGGAREMAGHVRVPTAISPKPALAERCSTEAEIMTWAAILQAKGFDAIPTCGNHDARGYCRGCAR